MASGSEDCFRYAAEGTIVNIKLKKFVNFRSISFYPSPRLNIITAPNGSGKSTLISAIVLALGGNPSVIGRSSHEADYIMSGQNRAVIQIELNNPHGRNHVIKRQITRKQPSGATSEWSVNKVKVTAAQVQNLVKKLNIQVDNLCQILPQDRVQDFAKMNRLEMFDNTQKTMGDSDLYKKFVRLKELRASQHQLKISIESTSKKHASLAEVIQGMVKDVEVIVEHKKVLKSVKTCSQKLAWAVYNEKKNEFDVVSDKMKDKEKELKELEVQGEPLKQVLKNLERKAIECKKDVASKVKTVCEVQEVLTQCRSRVTHVKNRISAMKCEAEEAARHRDRCLEEASQVETQLSDHQRKLGDFDEDSITQKIRAVDEDLSSLLKVSSELRVRRNQLNDAHSNANNNVRAVERSLSQANSGEQKKLGLLQNFPGAQTAYNWIKNNRQKISAPVHGPIFMELNVQDVSKAKYVENVIPHRDFIAFVAETSQATTEMLTLRSELRLNCNVACSEPPDRDLRDAYPPRIPIAQLRTYGFDCYLIDLVKGHPAVLAYLCKIMNFHNIPVAFNNINTANVPSNIKYYMAGDILYRVTVSKYSKQMSVSSQKLQPAKYLVASTDTGIVTELNKQLMLKKRKVESVVEEIDGLKSLERQNEAALNEFRNKKRELMAEREKSRGTLVRVKRLQDEHQRLLERANEPQADENALYDSVKKAVVELVLRQEAFLNNLRQFTEADMSRKLAEIEMDALSLACQSLRNRIESAVDSSSSIKRELGELRHTVEAAKQEARETEGIAKRSTDSLSQEDPAFKKKFGNAFNRLPSSVTSLREKLHTLNARARCLHNPQHDEILERYEKQKEEARNLEESLEKMNKDSERLDSHLTELRTEWRSQVDLLIAKINDSFSQFFSAMGCCGEIRLACNGDSNAEDAIENYGLTMLVKFRDTQPLTVVDGVTHSGGEKALATAVFLLSLQRLSISPFQCMDEINQGMDEFNERRVYNLLFNTITDVPTQFFLVTPKLLKNLDFPSHMSTHIIFNSGTVVVNLENEDD